MSKKKRTRKSMGINNPKTEEIHSIGNTIIPPKKGWFVKDARALLKQYDNLIKKLGKKYSANFSKADDCQDLFAYIKAAFIVLVMEYDPYSGVDFPGYIVRKLPLRIKYSYISKKFLQKKRTVLLRRGDYSINDLLSLIQDHGEGQITTDKKNRVANVLKPSRIDFSFRERIDDIEKHVPMDALDQVIFAYLCDGFRHYSYIHHYVAKTCKRIHIKTNSQEIHHHVKQLKKRLRNYYLQVPDSPLLLKH